MKTLINSLTSVAMLAFLVLAVAPKAIADTTLCTTITSLPFTITAPGKYCLIGNLSYSGTGVAAIDILSDDVVFDLNGFTVSRDNTGGDVIAANGSRRVVTVQNGIVKGGFFGVALYNTNFGLVQNIRVKDSESGGIVAIGSGNIVRNNQVWNVRASGNGSSSGIVAGGSGNNVINNDIGNIVAVEHGTARGILLFECDRSVVENNRIERTAAGGNSDAILIENSNNALVVNNRIVLAFNGIRFANATGLFRDNLAANCTVKYTGGTNAGNNQ